MAGTIQFTTSIADQNGSLAGGSSVDKTVTQTARKLIQTEQLISHTAASTIDVSAVTTPRALQFENLDTTHYIDIGVFVSGTVHYFAHLLPGEPSLIMYFPGAVYKALANTADALLGLTIPDS